MLRYGAIFDFYSKQVSHHSSTIKISFAESIGFTGYFYSDCNGSAHQITLSCDFPPAGDNRRLSARSAAIDTFGVRDPAKRVGRISHTHKGLRRAQCEPIGRALAQPTMRLSHQISKASLLWHTNPAKNPGKQEQFGESQSISISTTNSR